MDRRAQQVKRKIDNATKIIKRNEIKSIGTDRYMIESQSNDTKDDTSHRVVWTDHGWSCDCKNHTRGKAKCKHIHAVEILLYSTTTTKQTGTKGIEIHPITEGENCICPHCNSKDIVRNGKRKNKLKEVQKYLCRACKRSFADRGAFTGMTATDKIITHALQLYYSGESVRGIWQSLAQDDIHFAQATIYGWIKKYTIMIDEYMKKILPNLGLKWNADEIWVRINGDRKYIFAMMDADTRFWITLDVADSKSKHNTRELFRKSKEVAKKMPKLVTTDGLQSYSDAFKKEFLTQKGPKAKHVREIHLKDQTANNNNNIQERLNGTIRDREKTFRGLKQKDTPIILGMRIFYNYIRPHMGLNNDTPADRAGIKIYGCDKWLTLIQNAYASRHTAVRN